MSPIAKIFPLILLLVALCNAQETKSDSLYGAVIDMGSKGSRISVFTWPENAKEPYTEVTFGGGSKSPWYYKITPGITSLTNPAMAGLYLKPLLDYAESKIPSSMLSQTPIFIKGTDRLRQLNASVTEIILNTIYTYTEENYSFLLKPGFVDILPGILEGGYLWVAVNYLQNNFAGGHNKDCVGTLDMGSGSTQIAFIPSKGTDILTGYNFSFTYESKTYYTYVHSYTGYGFLNAQASIIQEADAATVAPMKKVNSGGPVYKVVKHPCYLVGYGETVTLGNTILQVVGTGSWASCADLTYAFLNTTLPCENPPCAFDGAFQPDLNGEFVGVSNYYDVVNFLGLPDDFVPSDVMSAGVNYCALSWSQAQATYPDVDLPDLASFCFGANYIYTLLEKGYGFGSEDVNVAKTVDGFPITWALGEMIHELQSGW